MARTSRPPGAAFAFALVIAYACGGPADPGGLGDRCFRATDCVPGLVCVMMHCTNNLTDVVDQVEGPPPVVEPMMDSGVVADAGPIGGGGAGGASGASSAGGDAGMGGTAGGGAGGVAGASGMSGAAGEAGQAGAAGAGGAGGAGGSAGAGGEAGGGSAGMPVTDAGTAMDAG